MLHHRTQAFVASHPGFDTTQEALVEFAGIWTSVGFNEQDENPSQAVCVYSANAGHVFLAAEPGRPLRLNAHFGNQYVPFVHNGNAWGISEALIEEAACPELAALMERLWDMAGIGGFVTDEELATEVARMFDAAE